MDIGGSAPIHLVGGSLGGIISSYVGGLEPHVETVIPIIGGGGLADRSLMRICPRAPGRSTRSAPW